MQVLKRGNGLKIVLYAAGETWHGYDWWGYSVPSEHEMIRYISNKDKARDFRFYRNRTSGVVEDGLFYAIDLDDMPEVNEFGPVTP